MPIQILLTMVIEESIIEMNRSWNTSLLYYLWWFNDQSIFRSSIDMNYIGWIMITKWNRNSHIYSLEINIEIFIKRFLSYHWNHLYQYRQDWSVNVLADLLLVFLRCFVFEPTYAKIDSMKSSNSIRKKSHLSCLIEHIHSTRFRDNSIIFSHRIQRCTDQQIIESRQTKRSAWKFIWILDTHPSLLISTTHNEAPKYSPIWVPFNVRIEYSSRLLFIISTAPR